MAKVNTHNTLLTSTIIKIDMDYQRTGEFYVNFSKEEIFPLLCPKMEEKWIPGWKCDVIKSESGHNEPNAKFKTQNAFNVALVWFTRIHNIDTGVIEFVNFAEHILIFTFSIHVFQLSENRCKLSFTHSFTALNDSGKKLIHDYSNEDFQSKLNGLGLLMESYLSKNRTAPGIINP